MCRKFEVNTFNNRGVITFCNFLSHNTRGYSTIYYLLQAPSSHTHKQG